MEGMLGGKGHLDYNNVPSVIYTHPVSGVRGREGGEGEGRGRGGWGGEGV